MFNGGMSMYLYPVNCPPVLLSNIDKNRALYRRRQSPCVVVQSSSLLVQFYEKISGSPNFLLNQGNTIGIIGGVSVFSTLNFLEKLVWWSTRDAEECPPFVVCSDPVLKTQTAEIQLNHIPSLIVQNLRHKRAFLEQSGARCIVMPCHVSHVWHGQVSEGCSIPFLHVGECVARELKEAKLKPLETGSSVRIGVLATDAILSAGFYQEKLQNQGFEVVLPDKATMEHTIIPAIESLNQRDLEGARNLLRIGIQLLLVRAVNTVIIASDEMQGVLPNDDPLLKKCIDPIDALVRSTVQWAKSNKKCK